ncbi:unnamed protein product [Ilex paraguariensis]|uniref:AAA+ ATPase domain-containing protein n=1 Tax=Ilex paraguariensis TaxID=185542 RepID=A0ABC8TZK2_9AQUA
MDVVNPILGIVLPLLDCVVKHAQNMKDLKASRKSLEIAMGKLKDISEDVKRQVELLEEQQMTRRKQVQNWLRQVEVIETQVNEILEKCDEDVQKKCLGGCYPKNCCSRYKLGKRVQEKLKVVDQLTNEGHFDVVADMLPRGRGDERPMEEIVGLGSMFEKVLRWMNDEQVKIIGIYGMGGAGKTTLLKKINNEFLKTGHGVDLIIWVVVSKQSNVEKIQEAICDQLKLPHDVWKNKGEDEKAIEIFRILRNKKFVLLLDDIWMRLDLLKVGVPPPDVQNTSKIVFTTRSEDVCGHMEADKKIKVECLSREEALALFRKKAGNSTLNSHPDITKLAEMVAKECRGLPLALITVGRAMAGRNDPRDWERAVSKLRKDPSKFVGMDEDVFHVLKFSYDRLDDDVIKSCFIYCCIYPEDYDIANDDLINHWIGERILDEFDDIYEARNQGHEIIGSLKRLCLLETGNSQEHVKMHDVIRDMALWIGCGSSGKKDKILVLERAGLIEAQGVTPWKEAERISMWGSSIGDLFEKPSCPNLLTFFVRHTTLGKFPTGFFQFMPAIRVLDLSSNFQLIELPVGIDKLVMLQYLNLSNSRIRELPVGLKNLKKMRYLLMNATYRMEIIPRQVISSLSELRVFSISGRDSSSDIILENNVLSGGRKALFEELECLEHLNDISITVFDNLSLQKIQSSHKIQKCISYLCIERCEGLTSLRLLSSSLQGMKHLERLDMNYCEMVSLEIYTELEGTQGSVLDTFRISEFIRGDYFHNLRDVYIAYCDNLLDLTWLIYAPTLQLLDVAHCEAMEEIVHHHRSREVPEIENSSCIFSRLAKISLIKLPRVKRIYPRALPFPSLMEVRVGSCARLRELPFDSNSAKNSLKEIRGAAWWWNSLQWEDETIEPIFRSYFVEEGFIW